MTCHRKNCQACEHNETRALIRRLTKQMEKKMTEGFARLDASFEGIKGDIDGLKASGAALAEQVATLTEGQDAAVAAGVEAALADFNTQLDAVAGRFEGLDAETPAAEAPEA